MIIMHKHSRVDIHVYIFLITGSLPCAVNGEKVRKSTRFFRILFSRASPVEGKVWLSIGIGGPIN